MKYVCSYKVRVVARGPRAAARKQNAGRELDARRFPTDLTTLYVDLGSRLAGGGSEHVTAGLNFPINSLAIPSVCLRIKRSGTDGGVTTTIFPLLSPVLFCFNHFSIQRGGGYDYSRHTYRIYHCSFG